MTQDHLLDLTSEIVSAYVSNSNVNVRDLSGLIQEVHSALNTVASKQMSNVPNRAPAVSVEESITPDFIICLEDGRKLKMLKRHLKAAYGLSPEQYRERWGLPADYPMVAPNYAQTRSNLAVRIGLGKSSKRRSKMAA
ncbi:MAG: MucR family transcriptional regulator [bacterium]|nr:MucR family transcriptional regulator [bacterium]